LKQDGEYPTDGSHISIFEKIVLTVAIALIHPPTHLFFFFPPSHSSSFLKTSSFFPSSLPSAGYQGEQNAGCGGVPQIDYYNCGLQSLIVDWRAKFQQPDLPFGAFLLAAWQANTPYFPLLRLIQVNASLTMTNVFTSSTLDQGDPAGGPVHSPWKQIPGFRASLGVLSTVYGKAATQSIGPRYSASTATSSTSVTISFTPESLYGNPLTLNLSVSCPTTVSADSCESFAVQMSDCNWYTGSKNLTASLSAQGTQLVLTVANAPSASTPVATRGLFGNWPIVQLYNQASPSPLPSEPWLSNIDGVTNNCPSPWDEARETLAMGGGGWVDDGQHA
jgi:hypothetical protein